MKIKKILGIIVLVGYLASELLSYLGYVDRGRVEAASGQNDTTPLVAVLIDNDTYNEIGTSNNFLWYTNDYLHEKYPGSQAVVFSLDIKEYSAPEIVKLLENVYFDGIEDKGSRLVGVIIMGDIPFPVVKYNNYIFPSIYPYVDFIDQKYIRNEDEGYFILNKKDGQAELRHGILNLENNQSYEDFFEKLKKYDDDPENFIDKKIWYDDFISLNKNFLEEIYYLYQNKLIFAEDLMYHRYTNFFVDLLQSDQQESNASLLGDLASGLESLGVSNSDISSAQDTLLNVGSEATPTMLLQNKISGFLKDYYEVLSTPLLRTIDDNIKASDRWEVNDSHYQKIQLKDQILLGNNETNGILKSINDKLEEYVDKKIANEKYSMKTTVPIYYYEGKDKRKRILFKKRYIPDYRNTYQFFYFGRDTETISNAEDFSIFRGSFRNLNGFVKYSSIINDTNNPAKSKDDQTDLTKKGVGASYDIFSTQVESNRGFNVLNMQSEYETYNKEKIHAERERKCTSYLFGIHWKILCKRKERVNKGNCEIGGDETGCENFVQFGNRVYGGGTPLNLDMEKYTNQVYEFSGEYNYRNAIRPLFDIAGSVKTTTSQNDAINFKGSKTYLSPTLISDRYGNVLGSDQHLEAPFHIGIAKAWFFNVNLGGKVFSKISNDQFMLKKNKRSKTDEELIYKYKIIPSEVKHDASQPNLINGYSGYRYTGDKESYIYYKSILDSLKPKQLTGSTETLVENFSGLNSMLANLNTKIRSINIRGTGAIDLTGLDEILLFSSISVITGRNYTTGQSENRDQFNTAFGTNYGDDALGYIEGYHNRQIQLNEKIPIWSEWFNEIILQIRYLKTYLTNLSEIGEDIFNKYNKFVESIEGSDNAINLNIEKLNARISNMEEFIIANSGSSSVIEAENDINNSLLAKQKLEQIRENIQELSGIILELNMIDSCTANHSVLGDIIGASSNSIKFGTEDSSSCEVDDDTGGEGDGTETENSLLSELIDSLNEAKTAFATYFSSDPDNPEEHIPGMNMLTADRPIDSPRYITFQGVGENVIKLIYPDIFKVEVYKNSGDNMLLKNTSSKEAQDEIYQALKQYFQNKVSEYNKILNAERNAAKSMTSHYNYIRLVDPLATPDMSVRPYKAFTYTEMIDAIGGEEMLHTLSELLYYQSISNRIREYVDDIGDDINETKKTFDINKKIGYILKEYLTEENDKYYKGELNTGDKNSYPGLIIPGYSNSGYEVGYINSNGNDSVTPGFDEIDASLTNTSSTNGSSESNTTLYTDDLLVAEASQDIKKDCNYDPNATLSLFNGDWFKGLACWLKNVAKKPVTLEIYFQPDLRLSSITEPIEESLNDFKEKFSSTIEDFQNLPVSDNSIDEQTQKILVNTQISWNDKKVSVLSKTGTLNFLSLEDLGDIIVKIESTGDNCLIINGRNSCNGPITLRDNPYRSGFSLNYSLAKDTIGTVITSISLCSSTNSCGVRNMSLAVVPGPITQFEIGANGGNKILAGAYTLLTIKAMDIKKNEILRSLEEYTVKVNKGKLIIGGLGETQQPINDFQNTNLLYRADPGTIGSVEFSIEDNEGNIITKNTANIVPGDIKLEHNNSEISSLKYTINNQLYYNSDGSFNSRKIIPIKISLKNGASLVPFSANIAMGSTRQLVKVMVADKRDDSGKLFFREVNSLNITGGEAMVYLVPGYVAGKDEINFSIPGLGTKTINVSLEPGELNNIGIILEKDVIDPKEVVVGKIALTDAWGNKINEASKLSVSVTTENLVDPLGRVWKASIPSTRFPVAYSGEWELSLRTTENDIGLHKIVVKTQDGKISASKTFTIRDFFLDGAIESGLNVLYLNLFGDDWGNQWGFGSKNSKYSEHIIQLSNKTLAVTTQLINPSKVNETNVIFGKDGNIQNNSNLNVNGYLNNAKLNLNIERVGNFVINDNIHNVKAIKNNVGEDSLLGIIQNNSDKSVFLYDLNDNYKYSNGVFYTEDGNAFASLKDNVSFELTSYSLGGYPIRDVTSNGQVLGSAIFSHLDFSAITGEPENIDYMIGDLYDKGSTSSTIKALYSRLNTLDNDYQGYASIQDSDDMEKYIGFRGDFKNITLFAEGESVGEATIPFGSEFLINIGDPLLKNRDEVASIRGLGQEKYSLPGKNISKVVDIDYNNDGLRDLLVISKDGTISLEKQYDNKKFQDLGTLMMSAEQIDEVYVGDVDGNKYEDIIIKNGNHQLRVYTNNNGVFDVDGNIVCLNTNVSGTGVTEQPESLSGVLQIFVDDMDNDGRTDIISLDKKGYLKIFYGNGSRTRHSYLSKDVYSCDKNRYNRQEGQTKLVKKFGLSLRNGGVSDESILRWNGLKYPSNEDIEKMVIEGNIDPNGEGTSYQNQGIYTDPLFIESMKDGNIDPNTDIQSIVAMAQETDTTKQAQKATEVANLFMKNPFNQIYEFRDGLNADEQAFITMYNVEKYNTLTETNKIYKPTKRFVDRNGGDLEEGDIIDVTVSINSPQGGNRPTTFFDKITGPWIIDRDPDTGAPKDLKFIQGSGTIVAGAEGFDYGIINIVGNGIQLKYSLTYRMETPIYKIRIEREDPLLNLTTVSVAEKDDTSILRWNGLKYSDTDQDILIKNPFGNLLAINDGINFSEQAYIDIENIGKYIERFDSKEIYRISKNYKDINGGSLDDGDKVEVTVKIPLPKIHAHLNAYFEKFEGPWLEKGIPGDIQFIKGNGTVKSGIGGYDFYITDFNEVSNGDDEYLIEFKYTLTYKDPNGTVNTDNLPYIVIQPIDGCIKKEEILENTKTLKNRAYKSKIVDLQEFVQAYTDNIQRDNEGATDDLNDQIINAQNTSTEDSTILNSIKESFGIKDLLNEAWNNILDKNGFDLGNIDLDITNILGVDIQNIERQVQDMAKNLCNGFTFGIKGKKSCEGLPVPFNQAFLAPGSYHIMGCIPLEPLTQTIGKGLPIFFWPGNFGPIFGAYLPIPYAPIGIQDQFLWLRGPGPYSSLIRIYAAPTLTAKLGIAVCVGPQKVAAAVPSPVSDIAGNCIVTAVDLPCGSNGGNNGDDDQTESNEEIFEEWVSEYGETNACTPSNSESPFLMQSSSVLNSTANNGGSYPISIDEGEYLGGLININYDPINSYSDLFDNGGDSAVIEINGVQINGVKDIKNKVLGGLQQGIQKILVDWFDRQVQYRINNLFRFEIEFTFPDISYLAEEISKISVDNISDIDSREANNAGSEGAEALESEAQKKVEDVVNNNKKSKGLSGLTERINQLNLSKESIRNLNFADGANPFKELQELFNETDLINVSTQNIAINVPRIYSDDIEAYKNYLLTRYEQNLTTLKGWEAAIEVAISNCNDEAETDPTKAPHCQALEQALAKILRLTSKFDKTAQQIFENVQTLEAYKRFPLEIYEWLHITDKYLGDVSALITNFFGYINYWMDVNATRFSQYVDAIITIVAIVKTYQIMIDLFVDRGAKCGKCTQDTYDQYSCKLSFLCNAFEIPTIPIPSVKIPSLYIDLSHLNLQMNVVLPRFSFNPVGIELPTLPNLPEPPQLGIDFDIDFDIPDVPLLPQPPELPELPSFVPQVKFELPILPPAPEIPEIPNQISSFISIAKTISKIFCIIKSGIGFVGESAVKARIEQMTQRTYEVPWVDNLDLTAYFKQTPLQGVDIQVDSFVNLQFNFDAFYAFLKSIVDEVNNATYHVTNIAQNGVQYINKTSAEWSDRLNDQTNQNVQFNVKVSKSNTSDKMKEELSNLRNAINNEQDRKKLDEVIAYTSIDSNVMRNNKGLSKIENDFNALIAGEKKSLNTLAELAKDDYDQFLESLNTINKKEPLQLTYSTNLLNKNEVAEKAIDKVNARDMLIDAENKKIDGYYSALKQHTAEELNMTDKTYSDSIKYLTSIKDTISEYYSIKRSEYAGQEILRDNAGNQISKPLLAQSSGNGTERMEVASTDYSQYIKGIFIKSGDNIINAVNSEYNYEKFLSYYEKDLDNDGKTELVMRDTNHLFVKYFNEVKNYGGKTSVVIKPTLKNENVKRYLPMGGLYAQKLKVYDENAEVKNFVLKGQSYDSINFSRDNNMNENIDGYLLRLVDRVDGLREKNSLNEIRYILLLPNEMKGEIENLNIQIQGNTQRISNLLNKKIYSIKYYNPSEDTLQFSLQEVPRKRQYVQVTTLKLNSVVYQQNAPRSNQLVGGRQVVGDGTAPIATVELLRSKKNDEIVDQGFDLEGYVGTYYTLKITREDPTKVRLTKLKEFDSENHAWKLLNEKDFDNFAGIVRLENLFFTGAQTKQYGIYAVDSQGNETEETINLNISIPGITIEDVERYSGYKEGIKNPVIISSKLETDVDKGTVSFERNRNNILTPISATINGEKKQSYSVSTNQTVVTGQYYDFGDEIGLYTKDNKLIATIDGENGNIKIEPEYASITEIRVDFSQGFPIIKIMQGGNAIFEIFLQTESLIKVENALGTSLSPLPGNNYGVFSEGTVLMKDRKPMLYIANNGLIYTTESLQGDYYFNDFDNTVTYKIYEPFSTSEIASVTFKAKPLD